MEVTCKNCTKVFEASPKKKNKAKYCSRECFHEYNKKLNAMVNEVRAEAPKKERTMNEKYAPVIIWAVLICIGIAWFAQSYVVKNRERKQATKELFLN